ncbi:MAG TPA: S53 family peptidase [Blastocatellia bacterium]
MLEQFASDVASQIGCAFLILSLVLLALPSAAGTKAAGAVSPRRRSFTPSQRARQIGEVPSVINDSDYIGQKPSTDLISMVISFAPADQTAMDEAAEDIYTPGSPTFHHWLKPEEFGQRFGRSQAEFQRAAGWITSQGLQLSQLCPNNLSIVFRGTVDTVQKTFGVTISQYRDERTGRIFYSNDRPPVLPPDLRAITTDLSGLNNAYLHHTGKINNLGAASPAAVANKVGHSVRTKSSLQALSANGNFFMAPADLQLAYDIGPSAAAGLLGQGQKAGIVIDSAVNMNDAVSFRDIFKLPPANLNNIVVPDLGQVGDSEDLEAVLDYSMISTLAPEAEIDVVVVPDLSFTNVIIAEEYIINTLMLPVVNESFGACEDSGFNPAEEVLFEQATLEGIGFFCSSGDQAAECVANIFEPEVQSPACYPWVTSVGGTSYSAFTTDKKGALLGIADEVVWNVPPGVPEDCFFNGTDGSGTGGGVSTLVAMPSYQLNAMGFPGGVPGLAAGPGRIVPDVSMLAFDPVTLVIFNGVMTLVGGTSMASPFWVGMMTVINQIKGSVQGFANPELYRLGTAQFKNNGPLVFTDITEGNNGIAPMQPCLPNGIPGFSAALGYDSPSGWGPADFETLAASFGVQNLPVMGVPAAPTINQLSARLAGDTLTLQVQATDPSETIASAQSTFLDSGQNGVGQSPPNPIAVRHSMSVIFAATVSGLSNFPTAENVSLVLTDKFGQQSSPVTANFSAADPGGPKLSTATLGKNGLAVKGSGLGGKLLLEVNGVIVGTKGGSGTSKTFSGTQTTLNLHSGINRVRVERNSLFSNIFLLQI